MRCHARLGGLVVARRLRLIRLLLVVRKRQIRHARRELRMRSERRCPFQLGSPGDPPGIPKDPIAVLVSNIVRRSR